MARLGDLIEQIRGISYKPEDLCDSLNEDGIPLLRANNIQDGKLNFEDIIYIDKKKIKSNQHLKSGDILVCTSSGSKELVGKAAFVENDLSMTFGAFCKVIRSKICYPKYIGHFFNSPYYRKKISASSAGANINNIRNAHIDELDIRLPSTDEQKQISTMLDKVIDLISPPQATACQTGRVDQCPIYRTVWWCRRRRYALQSLHIYRLQRENT